MTGPNNEHPPPGNGEARMEAGDTKTIRLTADYLRAGGSQGQFKAWQREAARLAREYLQSGREVHRLAFERHLGGMLMRLRRDRASAPMKGLMLQRFRGSR